MGIPRVYAVPFSLSGTGFRGGTDATAGGMDGYLVT